MVKAEIQSIGTYHCDFPSKFGLPRQSGLASEVRGWVVFEPAFFDRNYFRGLEDFSHLWLLWQFSNSTEGGATVRPPKLGGNERRGVFATRSPFRPNRIGLSCVRFESLDFSAHGAPILHVRGGDLMDGTPIFDVKPYLPYADAVPNAAGGFAVPKEQQTLHVVFTEAAKTVLPAEKADALVQILQLDPRPGYQTDETRVYGLPYADHEVRFSVAGDVLTVHEILPANG